MCACVLWVFVVLFSVHSPESGPSSPSFLSSRGPACGPLLLAAGAFQGVGLLTAKRPTARCGVDGTVGLALRLFDPRCRRLSISIVTLSLSNELSRCDTPLVWFWPRASEHGPHVFCVFLCVPSLSVLSSPKVMCCSQTGVSVAGVWWRTASGFIAGRGGGYRTDGAR